jgi:hypothetical protein
MATSPHSLKGQGYSAKFTDSYSLRCLMEFLRGTITEANIEVSPDHISIIRGDSHKSILHRVWIDTARLAQFYFNPEYEGFKTGVSLRDICNKIKNAQKKNNQLTLYNVVDVKNEFYAKFSTSQSTNPGIIFIPTAIVPDIKYDIGDYENPQPSQTIQVTEFSKSFGSVSTLRCQYAVIECYEKGMLIVAMGNGKIFGQQPIKDCKIRMNNKNENGPLICSYRIPPNTIKALSKITNISPPLATMQIFFAKGKPFKIVLPVGTYGQLETFMEDVDPITLGKAKK